MSVLVSLFVLLCSFSLSLWHSYAYGLKIVLAIYISHRTGTSENEGPLQASLVAQWLRLGASNAEAQV